MILGSFMDNVIQKQVAAALAEDIGSGDVSAQLLNNSSISRAQIITREPMVLAGLDYALEAFKQIDPNMQLMSLYQDGDFINANAVILRIEGNTKAVLTAERTALNFLQTLSGTASYAHKIKQIVKDFPTQILDTRKTIPGLRQAQKYAVKMGGCLNHRHGLYDAYLIKENHIQALGSIAKAIKKARQTNSKLFLEVEVETLTQLNEALREKPDRILLDNFNLDNIVAAIDCRNKFKQASGSYIPLEVSGVVGQPSKENLIPIAKTGVDFISLGSITKHLAAVDLSLRILETIEPQ